MPPEKVHFGITTRDIDTKIGFLDSVIIGSTSDVLFIGLDGVCFRMCLVYLVRKELFTMPY